MTQVTTYLLDCGIGEATASLPTPLIACNHCGIVALDTPAFGWRRWREESTFGDAGGEIPITEYWHHCAAAVEQNSWIAQGLVHMKAPDEAIEYENPDHWLAELVGADGD